MQKSPYSARYVGSMVSDIHRTILMGGIFMYTPAPRACAVEEAMIELEGGSMRFAPVLVCDSGASFLPVHPPPPASSSFVTFLLSRYPSDRRQPNGKLRLLAEIFPLAQLMEEAGGVASTGLTRCLGLTPKVCNKYPWDTNRAPQVCQN